MSTARDSIGARALGFFARDGGLRVATLAASATLLAFFLLFRDLPMVDLPQHAAQIATWQRFDAGIPDVVARFELNFRTPYLFAYPLARLLAPFVGAVVALKLVSFLAIALNLVAVQALARRLGHDPWLGLFGLVTASGLCFYFGFISFMLAMPLSVLALLLALEHASTPNYRRGVPLAVTLCACLLAHGVAFVLGFGCAGLVLLRGSGRWFARLLPLGAPVLLAVGWILPGPVSARIGGDAWELTARRALDFPALLVSMGAADHASSALGCGLLLVAGYVLGRRFERRPERWLPLALLLVAYALFPVMFRGIVLLHTRLPCFLLPLWLLALRPLLGPDPARRRNARLGILAVTVAWLALLGVRLARFNRETAAFHALTARLPPGLAMRPIIFEREARAFPSVPAYLHFSAYYYVEKAGSQGYSFAMYPISVVRYQKHVVATMQGGAEWRPDLFRRDEIDGYDYFLVHSARDRGAELFADAPVELAAHVGDWWGYERRGAAFARLP